MSFISKTFGGLNKAYYFRHLFFGAIIFIFLEIKFFDDLSKGVVDGNFIVATLVCLVLTLLYPYSRFVYESVVSFIFGENVFIVNALLMLFIKVLTIALCFIFSWAIAPIGLIYLYFHHSREEKLAQKTQEE